MILLMYFVQFALAAWPDASEGRQVAVQILREDVGNGFPMLSGTERVRAYESVCRMKKPYYPICSTKIGPMNKEKQISTTLQKPLVTPLNHWHKLSMLWQLGFIGGVPSTQAPNVELALQKLSFSCHEKSYAPGCSYLGDMYSHGVGVEQDYHKALELYEEALRGQ